MKPGNDLRARLSAAEVLLWGAAGVVAFAAHAGAVVLMMREPIETAASNQPPAAIMIDLAPEPEAAKVDDNQVSPDQHDAQEVVSPSMTPPVEEPPPEPIKEPQPDPAPPEPTPPEPTPVEPPPPELPKPEPIVEPKPVEQAETAPMENVEVPLPLTRPPEVQPQKKAEEAPKPVVKKKPQTPPPPKAQVAAREAKAEVTQSDKTAAQTTSSGLFSSSSATPAKWQTQLSAYLQRRKRYPRESERNKEEGTVYARFQIDGSGNVLSVSISRSSGFAGLDQAIVDMIRQASPVPAPPPEAGKTITVPFRFSLR
ncbi:energy transducer TonB [Rhizobium sp.]|jgi:periplasmic protein TonB|uniref:energy transducer TonB family protein n=1 Tax=Rhizobium sp. TaxID=391 RepID=UPI000E968F0D|nr:energy transducer TonB [Rhizobium sp.]